MGLGSHEQKCSAHRWQEMQNALQSKTGNDQMRLPPEEEVRQALKGSGACQTDREVGEGASVLHWREAVSAARLAEKPRGTPHLGNALTDTFG